MLVQNFHVKSIWTFVLCGQFLYPEQWTKTEFFDPLPPHLVHVVIDWPLRNVFSQIVHIFFYIGDINEENAKKLLIQLENDIHLDYNPIQLDTIEIELENDMRAIEMTPSEIDLENDLKWDPDLRTFTEWTLCNWHGFTKVLDVTIFLDNMWTNCLSKWSNYPNSIGEKNKKPLTIRFYLDTWGT